MEELDCSEEACIERYVTYAYFDEDAEDSLHIEGIGDNDSDALQQIGTSMKQESLLQLKGLCLISRWPHR
jgi:hypothetical protein